MAQVNRRVVALLLIVVTSGVIVAALILALGSSGDPAPLISQGRQLIADEQYAQAILPLQRALGEGAGENPEVHAMLAECYLNKPEPEPSRAAGHLERAKDLDPQNAEHRKKLIGLHGGSPQGIAEARALVEIRPTAEHYRILAATLTRAYRSEPSETRKQDYFNQALQAAEQAIAADPADFQNYQMKSQIIALHKGADALEELEAVATAAVEKAAGEEAFRAHLMLAGVHQARAQQLRDDDPEQAETLLEQAAEQYRQAMEAAPESPDPLLSLGRLAERRGNLDEAADWYRKAIEMDPQDGRGYLALAEVYRQQDKADEVLATLRAATAEGKPIDELEGAQRAVRFELLGRTVDLLLSRRELEAAGETIAGMREIVPEHSRIDYFEGRMRLLQNRSSEALDALQRAVDAQPGNIEYLRWLGMTYQTLGMPGRALEQFNRALERVAGGESAASRTVELELRRIRLAVLVDLGRFDEAARDARLILEANPGNYEVRLILARSLLERNDPEAALRVARQTVQGLPEEGRGYAVVAAIYQQLDRPEQAEQMLNQGLENAETGRLNLYSSLIQLYRRTDRPDEARAVLDRARADETVADVAEQALTPMLFESNEEMIRWAREQVDEAPDDAARVRTLAVILMRVGQQEEALEQFQKALRLAVEQAEAAEDEDVRRGRRSLAMRIWQDMFSLLVTTEDPTLTDELVDRLPDWMDKERRISEGLIELARTTSPPEAREADLSPVEQIRTRVAHADRAIETFESLLAEEPAEAPDTRLLSALARAYFLKASLPGTDSADLLQQAASYYNQVLESRPNNAPALVGLATVFVNLNRYDQAIAQANKILDSDANNTLALEVKALAEQGKGDYASAIATRRQLREAAPDNVQNLVRLGQLLETQPGTAAEAAEVYRQARELAPDSATATRLLAELLGKTGETEQADDLVRTFLGEHGDDPATLIVAARYYANTGRPREAIDLARKAVDLAPDNLSFRLFASTLLAGTGQLDASADVVQEFVDAHPDSAQAKVHLADVLRRRAESLDRAEQLVREALSRLPDKSQAEVVLGRILLSQAVVARDEDEADRAEQLFAEARRTLQGVLDRRSDFGEALIALADLSRALGEPERALVYLQRIGRSDATFIRAMLQSAAINLRLGNNARARSDLTALLQVEPRHIDARLQLYRLHLAQGELPRARQVLRDGLAYSPDSPDLLMAMAEVHLAAGEPAQALEVLDPLRRDHPDNPGVWEQWAIAKTRAGAGDEAVRLLRQAVDEHPEDLRFTFVLARQLGRQKQFDQAVALIEPLVAEHPDDPVVYEQLAGRLAEKYLGARDRAAIDRAVEVLKTGLAKTDRHPALLAQLIHVNQLVGDWQRAAELSREIIERFPDNALAYMRLSESLLQLGQYDDALQAAFKAVELNPRMETALNNIAWIYATEKNDLARARQYATEALAQAPNSANVLDTSGWIEYLRGNYATAIEELERALSLRKTPTVVYHLGMAYKGRSEHAASDSARRAAVEQARRRLSEYLEMAGEGGEYADEAQKALDELP